MTIPLMYRALVTFVGSFGIASLFFLLQAPNLEWSLTYVLWILPAVAFAIYCLFRGESRVFWVAMVALAALATSLVLRLQDWAHNCTNCSPTGAGSFLSWGLGTQVRALSEIAAFVCYLIALAWLVGNLSRFSSHISKMLIIGNLILLLEALFLLSDLFASNYWQTPEVFSGITKAYFLIDFKFIYSTIHVVEFLTIFAFICWPKNLETKSQIVSKK